MQATSPRELDAELARHSAYGEPHRCIRERESVHLFLLDVVSDVAPETCELKNVLEALPGPQRSRVLRSPVFQATVNQLARDMFGRQPTSPRAVGVLRRLISVASDRQTGPVETSCGERLSGAAADAEVFIWRDDEDILSTELRTLFREQVLREGGTATIDLRSPDGRMSKVLQAGAALLDEIVPELARSMFAHVSLVAIVDDVDPAYWSTLDRKHLFESGSSDGLPAVLFLTPNAVVDEWVTAEALFHEACHQKLFDLVKTKSIYRAQSSGNCAQRIPCLWRRTGGQPDPWITDRAFLGLHVYVYLALYYLILADDTDRVIRRSGLQRKGDSEEAFREAADRAHYLARVLHDHSLVDLGDDGRRLLEWLREQLERRIDGSTDFESVRERVSRDVSAVAS